MAALVANRLAAPSPLYDVAGWASGAAMAECLAVPAALLNDDRLGRALEALRPVAEDVRGAAVLAAIEAFGVDAARLHVDLTTLRVAGAYEGSSLVQAGWGPDRRVARQVKALAATTASGVPLYVRPCAGAAAELGAIGDAFERLRALAPPGLVVVADSAYGHLGPLCAADRAGLRFVVPLRADTGFAERFLTEVGHEGLHRLAYVSARQRRLPPRQRTRYLGALRPFVVTDPATGSRHSLRVLYVWSSEEQRSVAEARERALAKAEEALAKVRNGLGGRYYKTRADVEAKVAKILVPAVTGLLEVRLGAAKARPGLTWHRRQDVIDERARTDGIYALATNLPGRLSADTVLDTYKGQETVERSHKDFKQTLRVRPVFLHNDDRIEALVSVVGLALLVFGLIEADLRRALGGQERLTGLLPEGRAGRPTGRSILAAFQGLGLTYTAEGIVLDRLTATQARILELLEVPVPWPQQGKLGRVNCGIRG